MASRLEVVRQMLEDVDALEAAIVTALDGKTKTQRDRMNKSHTIAAFVGETQKLAQASQTSLADKDASLATDVAAMGGDGMYTAFYSRLRGIREYHVRNRTAADPDAQPPSVLDRVKPTLTFSGEEAFGRYLDLVALHTQYINVPGVSSCDYLSYLACYADVGTVVEKKNKSASEYKQYMGDLLRYLLDFHTRTQPLVPVQPVLEAQVDSFVEAWGNAELPGWEGHTRDGAGRRRAGAAADDSSADGGGGGGGGQALDLDAATCAADLEKCGLDALKLALMARGLKCGGSLSDRASRLFSVKGMDPKDYPKKLRAKGKKGGGGGGGGGAAAAAAGAGAGAGATAPSAAPTTASYFTGIPCADRFVGTQAVAWVETCIRHFGELLTDTAEETRMRVQKRHTRTLAEIAADIEAEAAEGSDGGDGGGGAAGGGGDGKDGDSSDEDEQPIYNPKNLPLGWDGKPIPYWLYKLHGLDKEFKCEICGDQSYWGPLAYDRHFQEPRHASGMRRLGIPNTRHFFHINIIQDALNLYATLRDKITTESFKPEEEEEFEDSEGNVLDRKTYEDLARQGLL